MYYNKMSQNILNKYSEASFPNSFSGVNSFFKSFKKVYPKTTKNQVVKVLSGEDAYILHRSKHRRKYRKNQVIVSGIDDTWQADLVDVQKLSRLNKGFRYILTVIDVFSKKAWVVMLKDKGGKTVHDAFSFLFKNRVPKRLHVDNGKEFYNKDLRLLLEKYDIKMYSTKSDLKASIVERFNRTLKDKMWRMFTKNKNKRYSEKLQELVDSYNNSIHRSIKTTPNLVNKKNEKEIWNTLYGYADDEDDVVNVKFKQGDKVRVSKYKYLFDKGYEPKWSSEIFIVDKVILKNPTKYIIKDLEGGEIDAQYFDTELVKIS